MSSSSRKRKSPWPDTAANITDHEQTRKKRKLCENEENTFIEFDIRSWGWMDSHPYKSYIKLTNNKTLTKGLKSFDMRSRRGHRIVVMDGTSGDMEQSICFDTWADIYGGIRLQIFLKTLQLKANKWVVIITHDSGYNINAEAAWPQFEDWHVKPCNHPLHREAFILILSTNRNVHWWQNIVNPQDYFLKKYDKTIHSWNKKIAKKLKKLHKKNINNSTDISPPQLELLQNYGQNVFFQKKCKPGKGALILKGFLPRMKLINIENCLRYRSGTTPFELAQKNGIKPCDTDTHKFYCVSCLNSSDCDHLLICTDDIHENDENAAHILPIERMKRREKETGNARQEIDNKFRVKACGQAFHIYCVSHPQQIWLRWCTFMNIPTGNTTIPSFVELNIKKQEKIWRNNSQTNIHRKESDVELVENKWDTGNIDFYGDEYSEEYALRPLIRDLSAWLCHQHNDRHPSYMYCLCGNPMVEQLCLNAKGETKYDGDFQGLYCNNYEDGCTELIAPNEMVFRCMNGARCKDTADGWDYCRKCMLQNIIRYKPKILCLCGRPLVLGKVHNVRAVFGEKGKVNKNQNKNKNKRNIKKANTYRCGWCLCKFCDKNESVYYCNVQSDKCCRLVKNHFLQIQPFVLCIGCIVQSKWLTLPCDCGCNLHCRLLADWIHHDLPAYDYNNLSQVPARPNGQQNVENKEIGNENALDFYMSRRANDDEELYWNALSVKYVNCAVCGVQILMYEFVFLCNNRCHGADSYYLCGKCAVSNRLSHSLYPLCAVSLDVEVCLLFIAHDGVSQSVLWEEWLSENASIGKKFGVAVQCNNFNALKTGKEFAEKYRIDVQRATSWGKLLVPLTIQKSIQISLRKYPQCSRFYIISGREIPLVSTQHLYGMPNKTQLMAKKIVSGPTAAKISAKRMGKLLQWYSGHAAMSLSRCHAEIISVTPWKEYFSAFDYVYDNIGAPDEFLFATTLAAFGCNMKNNVEIWREVTTDFELPPKLNVRHPILFNSLDDIVEYWIVNEKMDVCGKEKKSLKQLLCDRYRKPYRLWGYGPCFFRKISQNVNFTHFKPWQLCTMKPPIIDKEKNIDQTINYRKELESVAYMDQDEILAINIQK